MYSWSWRWKQKLCSVKTIDISTIDDMMMNDQPCCVLYMLTRSDACPKVPIKISITRNSTNIRDLSSAHITRWQTFEMILFTSIENSLGNFSPFVLYLSLFISFSLSLSLSLSLFFFRRICDKYLRRAEFQQQTEIILQVNDNFKFTYELHRIVEILDFQSIDHILMCVVVVGVPLLFRKHWSEDSENQKPLLYKHRSNQLCIVFLFIHSFHPFIHSFQFVRSSLRLYYCWKPYLFSIVSRQNAICLFVYRVSGRYCWCCRLEFCHFLLNVEV